MKKVIVEGLLEFLMGKKKEIARKFMERVQSGGDQVVTKIEIKVTRNIGFLQKVCKVKRLQEE